MMHPTTHLASHARGDLPGRIITGSDGVYFEDRDGNIIGIAPPLFLSCLELDLVTDALRAAAHEVHSA